MTSEFDRTPAPQSPTPSFQVSAPPSAYRYEDLAVFCRIEVQLEKAARLPVKVRLGDVQYTDQLEGKRPSY